MGFVNDCEMSGWWEELNKEVIVLFHHLNLFKQLMDIINENERLKSMDSTVLDWMTRSFVVDMGIGIGRICDNSGNTKSLVKFLERLKKSAQYLTRERHLKLYKDEDSQVIDIPNRTFDNIAGEDSKSYSRKQIEQDIKKLKEEDPCLKIIKFRNQYLAHMAKDKEPIPSYDELFSAFKIIKNVMKQYNLLLRAASCVDFTPVIQGYWEEVFTIPWIEEKERVRLESPVYSRRTEISDR